jgi:hypothetical protein
LNCTEQASTQTPFEHTPEQQLACSVHSLPTSLQAAQAPSAQTPLQHWLFCWQLSQ